MLESPLPGDQCPFGGRQEGQAVAGGVLQRHHPPQTVRRHLKHRLCRARHQCGAAHAGQASTQQGRRIYLQALLDV